MERPYTGFLNNNMSVEDKETEENFLYDLTEFVQSKPLTGFYKANSAELHEMAALSVGHVQNVHPRLISSVEIAQSLARLSLYDIILLLDDSSSMTWDQGKRIKALQVFLERITSVTTITDPSGITLAFLNHDKEYDFVDNATAVSAIIEKVRFNGWTMLGTRLWKLLEKRVLNPAKSETLNKPVLVMIITDGEPAGPSGGPEKRDTLKQSILKAKNILRDTKYGEAAVAFQIARVGNDANAKAFVNELNHDEEIGGLVDCISEEKIEKADVLLKSETDLTSDLWVMKLMVGAIDSWFNDLN